MTAGRASIRFVPALMWMGVIFRLSAIPGSRIPGRFSVLGHFVAYAVLGALLYFAFQRGAFERTGRSRGSDRSRAALVAALVAASLYGISDEFHQAFVPGRMPDAFDWAVDTAGAFVGAAAMAQVLQLTARRPEGRRAGEDDRVGS